MKKTSVGVFLKAPVANRVKTRLARHIGAQGAAELYRKFVRDTLEWLAAFRGPGKVLFYTPKAARASCEDLLPRTARFRWIPQARGALGNRLAQAFDVLLADGVRRAVVVGTDCPLLGADVLHEALRCLDSSDIVLGPAADGGYYLVGLRRPQPRIFQEIPWSSPRVLERTLERARQLSLKSALLGTLSDVDTIRDVQRLRQDLEKAWHSAATGERRDFPVRTFRHISWLPLQASGQPGTPGEARGIRRVSAA